MSDAVEVYQDDRATRRAVAEIKAAPLTVGDGFKTGGEIDWGAVALAVNTAVELGLAPRTNYKFFPVVKGTVYPMAEICRVLLFRHGGDLQVTRDDATACTVVVTGPNGRIYPPFTVTAAEAEKAGWGKASGLVSSDIRSILRARASMRAIKLNCPQVLAGPPSERFGDWQDPGPEAAAEPAATGPELPAVAPRQAAVGSTTRDKIRTAIDRLTPGQRHDVIERWRAEQLPAIDQLDLDQFMAALDIILDVLADERPPDDAYEEPDPDREEDADNYRYSVPEDEDPGRPFT